MTDDEWAYFELFRIRRGGRPPRKPSLRAPMRCFGRCERVRRGATYRRNLATGIRSFGNFDAGPKAASSTSSSRRLSEAAHVMSRCRWSMRRLSEHTIVPAGAERMALFLEQHCLTSNRGRLSVHGGQTRCRCKSVTRQMRSCSLLLAWVKAGHEKPQRVNT